MHQIQDPGPAGWLVYLSTQLVWTRNLPKRCFEYCYIEFWRVKEFNSVDVVRLTQDQKTISFTMMAQPVTNMEMYFRCDPGMGQQARVDLLSIKYLKSL